MYVYFRLSTKDSGLTMFGNDTSQHTPPQAQVECKVRDRMGWDGMYGMETPVHEPAQLSPLDDTDSLVVLVLCLCLLLAACRLVLVLLLMP